MSTPKNHRIIGTGYAGSIHYPGHPYRDCTTTISEAGGSIRVEVVESWGQCQGYDEEHGRHHAIARGKTIDEAIERVVDTIGRRTDINVNLAQESICLASDEAHDALTDESGMVNQWGVE